MNLTTPGQRDKCEGVSLSKALVRLTAAAVGLAAWIAIHAFVDLAARAVNG